ncbi:PPM-type phosphatase domain-containing protein, partial [Haematococcus lacustris]
VAKFCQRYLVAEFSRLRDAEGVEAALIKVFHRMDDMLRDTSRVFAGLALPGARSFEHAADMRAAAALKRFMGGDGDAPAANSVSSGSSSATSDTSNGFRMDESPDPDEGLVQAGCTAVVAVKQGSDLYVANAGDSRGVLCRAGKAVALSEDHKPAQEVERSRIIAAGGFLSEIGGVTRVNGNLNLSRAIGDLKYKSNVELEAKDQIITAQPDIMKVPLTPEDRFFVLACDGVWDVMSNQDVVDFIGSKLDLGMSASAAACALLDACLAHDPKEARGVGCDNMTA